MRGIHPLPVQPALVFVRLASLVGLTTCLAGCVAPQGGGLRPSSQVQGNAGSTEAGVARSRSARDSDVLEAPPDDPATARRATAALTESNATGAQGANRDALKWTVAGFGLTDPTRQVIEKLLKEYPKARWHQSGAIYDLPNGGKLRWITGVHLAAGRTQVESGYNTLTGREELGQRGVSVVLAVSPMNPHRVVSLSIEKRNPPDEAPTQETFLKSLVEKYGEPDFRQTVHAGGDVAIWHIPDTDTMQLIWFEKGAHQFRDWKDAATCYGFAGNGIQLAQGPLRDYNLLVRQYRDQRVQRCGRLLTYEVVALPGNKVVSYRGQIVDTEALVDSHLDLVNDTNRRQSAADEAQQKSRETLKPQL